MMSSLFLLFNFIFYLINVGQALSDNRYKYKLLNYYFRFLLELLDIYKNDL